MRHRDEYSSSQAFSVCAYIERCEHLLFLAVSRPYRRVLTTIHLSSTSIKSAEPLRKGDLVSVTSSVYIDDLAAHC
jgi:hypothetical protein